MGQGHGIQGGQHEGCGSGLPWTVLYYCCITVPYLPLSELRQRCCRCCRCSDALWLPVFTVVVVVVVVGLVAVLLHVPSYSPLVAELLCSYL